MMLAGLRNGSARPVRFEMDVFDGECLLLRTTTACVLETIEVWWLDYPIDSRDRP